MNQKIQKIMKKKIVKRIPLKTKKKIKIIKKIKKKEINQSQITKK